MLISPSPLLVLLVLLEGALFAPHKWTRHISRASDVKGARTREGA